MRNFYLGYQLYLMYYRKKLNYTLLFLRYYIIKQKVQNDSLLIPDFI